jgi:hypothetical protein
MMPCFLHVPLELPDGIQFRKIGGSELNDAYRQMEASLLGASTFASCRCFGSHHSLQAGSFH